MTINVTTAEGRWRELRNNSLITAKKNLERVEFDLNYLIMATPTGERRNAITSANIHIMSAIEALKPLKSEEAPDQQQ